MRVGILGAGAFGTALAISLSRSGPVGMWSRNPKQAADMERTRENTARLSGFLLPASVAVTSDFKAMDDVDTLLISVPLQRLRAFIETHSDALLGKTLVACCKGIELKTGRGPLDIIEDTLPGTTTALMTGPSFAQDIAKGLPTALTLACSDPERGAALQQLLSNNTLRLYRTTDVIGASLGGALKNVIAIACGTAIGAGLGESARAALMTRGNAEMLRLAAFKGADPATLAGLSGFGDLVLTCTSTLSRNYRLGLAIGTGDTFDPNVTVEGAATAQAVAAQAKAQGLDMPISTMVAALVENRLDVDDAMTALLSRSLKEE